MANQAELKDLLFEVVTQQLRDGVVVKTKDGEIATVDVGAPVLAVAAKLIKDWADDGAADAKAKEQQENLQRFLNRRRPDLAASTTGEVPN